METTVQATPAAPRRRAPAAKPAAEAKAPKPARAKKLPAAAVEATAEAFMAGFKALPGAVQARIVEMIDEYEDELDVQELNAAEAADPEDFDPKNSITLDDYMRKRQERSKTANENHSLAA